MGIIIDDVVSVEGLRVVVSPSFRTKMAAHQNIGKYEWSDELLCQELMNCFERQYGVRPCEVIDVDNAKAVVFEFSSNQDVDAFVKRLSGY